MNMIILYIKTALDSDPKHFSVFHRGHIQKALAERTVKRPFKGRKKA
ncbi:hypothetical protein SD77_2826 [Bacillus badius]|uniref:Mobile element protein n=1 Tax=Bacillus badius TaxID=1455 RepID=A0ABR5APK7_BACBA|nr:hypothetical protein SD78_1170 [Bacillus badius]KIL75764.1 hypothetical protein SD77_2826 [Bacillus badius]